MPSCSDGGYGLLLKLLMWVCSFLNSQGVLRWRKVILWVSWADARVRKIYMRGMYDNRSSQAHVIYRSCTSWTRRCRWYLAYAAPWEDALFTTYRPGPSSSITISILWGPGNSNWLAVTTVSENPVSYSFKSIHTQLTKPMMRFGNLLRNLSIRP